MTREALLVGASGDRQCWYPMAGVGVRVLAIFERKDGRPGPGLSADGASFKLWYLHGHDAAQRRGSATRRDAECRRR